MVLLRRLFLAPLLPLALFSACGGGSASNSASFDPGKLWVSPDPAILTPGARLTLTAVPEVHSEAPFIRSTTWTVIEPGGGSLQVVPDTYGQYANYTAPTVIGTYHVKATSEFGTTRYVPQHGTVRVVDPKEVGISVNPTSFVIQRNYTGSFPKPVAVVAPISNHHVEWSVVEPGFEGPSLIRLQPDASLNTCLIIYDNMAIDHLPGTQFHIRVQSFEVASAFALIEVQVQR